MSSPIHFGHRSLSAIDSATAQENPTMAVFFAESQIFPSINLTICMEPKSICNRSSVSIDASNVARTCAAKSAGNLPLKIDDAPPTLLRSARSMDQITAYYSTLRGHKWVNACNVVHHYAVITTPLTS